MKIKKTKECRNVGMAYGINVVKFQIGDILVVPDDLGKALIKLGCFEEVKEEKKGKK